MRICVLEILFANVLYARTLPTVKPGLFVIHGVYTCGGGNGFCLMGSDCTVNEEFLPDPEGHCEGLRSAFIPESHFSCCRYVANNSTFDELGAYQPPTTTLFDETNETATSLPDSLNEYSVSSWMGNNSVLKNSTEETLIGDEINENRMSGGSQEDAEQVHSNTLPVSEEYSPDANVHDALYLENTAPPEYNDDSVVSNLSASNSTPTEKYLNFPATGSIDVGHNNESVDESDSTHSLQHLETSKKSGQNFLEIGGEDLEPRAPLVTDSEQESNIDLDLNDLDCNEDLTTDSGLFARENVHHLDDSSNESKFSRELGELVYPKDINDHKHERSPIQWFRISRKLGESRPTVTNFVNSPVEFPEIVPSLMTGAVEPIISVTVPEELRDYSSISKDKFSEEQCWGFPSADENVPRCMNVWKFVSNNGIICFGTLINSIWILTSASCITKIYQDQMELVMASDVEEKSGFHGLSNMIVHENYLARGQDHVNNIGLISLDKTTNFSCFVCLSNQEKKYAEKTCSTYILTTTRYNEEYFVYELTECVKNTLKIEKFGSSEAGNTLTSRTICEPGLNSSRTVPSNQVVLGSLDKCEGRVKVLNIHSKLYLSLLCPGNNDVDDLKQRQLDYSSGNVLWCEDSLIGIESIYKENEGLIIFSPALDYAEWIQRNIQQYL